MKKGYTFIELMVVLMIVGVVSLTIFTLVWLWGSTFKARGLDKCKLQVISFVYYSQNYCKANEKTAYINFYRDKDILKMALVCDGKEINKINICGKPYKIQYTINKKKENYIELSNLGMINNVGEIEVEYDKNKKIYILIGTGGVYSE